MSNNLVGEWLVLLEDVCGDRLLASSSPLFLLHVSLTNHGESLVPTVKASLTPAWKE
jgi:hypothetical protein